MPTTTLFVPPSGHTIGTGLREIADAGGTAIRVELAPQTPYASSYEAESEFDTTRDLLASPGPWTVANGAQADAINANTQKKSKLYFDLNAANSDWIGATRNAPFVYRVKSGNFTAYTRLAIADIRNYQHLRILAQSTSDPDDWMQIVAFVNTAGTSAITIRKSSTVNGATSSDDATPAVPVGAGDLYIRLDRTSNDFRAYYSLDGKTWVEVGTTTTRADFSADANLGLSAGSANTSNTTEVYADFIRTVPPLPTTSPTSSVVIDSGYDNSTWKLSTFNALVNADLAGPDYSPQGDIGFSAPTFQYGASNTNPPPTLNGSDLTETQMQGQADATGRYLKIQVKYPSSDGYAQSQFYGALIGVTTVDASDTTPPSAPTLTLSSVGNGQVALVYTPPSSDYASGEIEYDGNGAVATLVVTTAGTYTITGLTNDESYHFTARAKDSAGNWSGRSKTVMATPRAATPVGDDLEHYVGLSVAKQLTDAAVTSVIQLQGYRDPVNESVDEWLAVDVLACRRSRSRKGVWLGRVEFQVACLARQAPQQASLKRNVPWKLASDVREALEKADVAVKKYGDGAGEAEVARLSVDEGESEYRESEENVHVVVVSFSGQLSAQV